MGVRLKGGADFRIIGTIESIRFTTVLDNDFSRIMSNDKKKKEKKNVSTSLMSV